MIDLVAKFDKNAQAIVTNLTERITRYFRSQSFLILKGRYDRLRDSNNMKYSSSRTNSFIGKFVVPLVKEISLQRRALIKRAYAGEPFASFEPTGNTPLENATNMQDVTNQNLRTINFRANVFSPSAKAVAQYGSDVMYLEWVARDKVGSKTVQDPETGEFVQQKDVILRRERNVQVRRIHLLNYFTDPAILRHWEADIQGHIERIAVWELEARVMTNPSFYIKETVEKVIRDSKRKGFRDTKFFEREMKETPGGAMIDIRKGYGIIPIQGNEDSDQRYYFEMIGDQIIAFKHNFHDQDIVPYYMPTIDPHEDYFWGNTDSEYVQQYENISNALINASVSSTLRSMQQLKLFRKGQTDIASIQEAIRTNGWVGIENTVPAGGLKDVIHEHQNNRQDQGGINYLLQEIKEGASRVSAKSDLQRNPNQGGIRNDTATAASIIANEGDILDSDYLESLSNGWRKGMRDMAIMLQQNLPERFNIRPGIRDEEREMGKEEIMGMFNVIVKTSLQKNRVLETTRKINALTQLINLINAAPQQLQGINIAKVTRDVIKDMDIGDVDETFPEQEQQQVPGAVPTAPAPGGPQQVEAPVQAAAGQPPGPTGGF